MLILDNYGHTSDTPVGQIILNESHLKINISFVKIFDFDMIYLPYLSFNLPFGFANPPKQRFDNPADLCRKQSLSTLCCSSYGLT